MQDFWLDSGYKHLARNDHGWLRVTPDWIRHLLARPELAPIESSGPCERQLHQALVDDPLRAVSMSELEAVEDADTRENVIHFLNVRKKLLDAVTLERFYLNTFRSGHVNFPPAFLDLAAHAILRAMLEGCDDVYRVRAAEMFFRRQRISTDGGRVLSADAETIQLFAETGGFGDFGRLMSMQGTAMRGVNMDVLSHENAPLYWFSENRYNYVLDLTHGGAGVDALATNLAAWVRHFTGSAVTITPQVRIDDEHWRWHVGLDVESSAILNDLYNDVEVEAERLARLVALFRLDFQRDEDMRADVAGMPAWLAAAVTPERVLKLKPQNLLVNLPFAGKS
jgi:hypothetical protein